MPTVTRTGSLARRSLPSAPRVVTGLAGWWYRARAVSCTPRHGQRRYHLTPPASGRTTVGERPAARGAARQTREWQGPLWRP